MDHADVIAMQNWQHLTTVLDAVNRIPVKHADVDVMRVRESHLEGLARHPVSYTHLTLPTILRV